jgi:hypothetical protein
MDVKYPAKKGEKNHFPQPDGPAASERVWGAEKSLSKSLCP